ncbi:MAG: amidohydrolase [Chloroflexi bacterium]|nr:MAG: amidohydrolase [Chloroflexota bacterium]
MLKIDVFPHILPRPFFDRLMQVAPSGGLMVKRVQNIPVMIDVEKRFEIMDRHEGYAQVLTLAAPPLENVAGADLTPDLARLANDEMARLVERYPDRFPGFVASLPMNNPDAAMREIGRAIDELGATGVQVFTNVNGQPLDKPEYLQVFERMAAIDLPVWMHPARTAAFADYPGESRSKYDLWWAFGWPYETAVAMGRLLFSGLFDRQPNLKVITHHLGGMVPHFEGRVGGGLDQLGKRTDDAEDAGARGRLKQRPIDYFRMFYGDTALFGPAQPIECGLEFFGVDHVLFGTDMPFDPEGGPGFVRDTIKAVNAIDVSEEDRRQIFEGNARRMLRLKVKP